MKIPQRVINTLRKQHEKFPDDYDLCAAWNGTLIDIVSHYAGGWRVSVGRTKLGYADTRESAIVLVENFRL